jgi:hypothetical protein
LTTLSLDHDGAITLESLDTVLSDAADAAEEAAPGQGADAAVWEELVARTGDDSRSSVHSPPRPSAQSCGAATCGPKSSASYCWSRHRPRFWYGPTPPGAADRWFAIFLIVAGLEFEPEFIAGEPMVTPRA